MISGPSGGDCTVPFDAYMTASLSFNRVVELGTTPRSDGHARNNVQTPRWTSALGALYLEVYELNNVVYHVCMLTYQPSAQSDGRLSLKVKERVTEEE